jgi:hypothetical protein
MSRSDPIDAQLEHLTPSSFLHHQESALLRELTASTEPAQRLKPGAPSLVTLPHLLAHLQAMARNVQSGIRPCVPEELRRQVEQLIALPGFAPFEIVQEVTVLRRCIIRGWLKAGARASRNEGVTILDEVLDQLTLAVLERWTEAEQRTFKVLDRVSDVIAQSRHLPELLAGLARLLRDAARGAKWVTLWLKEENALVQKVAWGLEVPEGGTVRVRLPKGLDTAKTPAPSQPSTHPSWEGLGPLLLSRQEPEEGPSVLFPITHEGHLLGLARVGHGS